MIIAYQVILILVILIGFIGAIGERKDKDLRTKMTALCIAAMVSFIISTKFL
ncbi:hypothetical protein SAMN05518684_106213 [Salipaludibacillus aurantiacus]|uniref:Uncharacterized protein n=1 Tax=Salipaludibacillus aurantiacus TaxID=1601833 RepID=A0A1H9TZQ6_9BACI|nr:hypothetical protein SAMN05518684_106213 [Salipaludibacillus aurantiacus]